MNICKQQKNGIIWKQNKRKLKLEKLNQIKLKCTILNSLGEVVCVLLLHVLVKRHSSSELCWMCISQCDVYEMREKKTHSHVRIQSQKRRVLYRSRNTMKAKVWTTCVKIYRIHRIGVCSMGELREHSQALAKI